VNDPEPQHHSLEYLEKVAEELLSRQSDSDRLSVLRSRLGRAGIAYSLGSHSQPCGAADQERILAQM
jgi:hypothetical protein